jgi:hypothetical protein
MLVEPEIAGFQIRSRRPRRAHPENELDSILKMPLGDSRALSLQPPDIRQEMHSHTVGEWRRHTSYFVPSSDGGNGAALTLRIPR